MEEKPRKKKETKTRENQLHRWTEKPTASLPVEEGDVCATKMRKQSKTTKKEAGICKDTYQVDWREEERDEKEEEEGRGGRKTK